MMTSHLRSELIAAVERCAETDEERVVARRILNVLGPALRVYELDVLTAAASEITAQLAPTDIAVTMDGDDPAFRITQDPASEAVSQASDVGQCHDGIKADADAHAGKSTARISLRLPESLKKRVDAAASASGRSVNSWIIDALATAVHASNTGTSPSSRLSGWVR